MGALQKTSWKWLVLLLGLGLGFDLICRFLAESLWFQEVGYFTEFLTRLATQMSLGAIAILATAGFFWGNLTLAKRFQYPATLEVNAKDVKKPISLSKLISLVLILAATLGVICLQLGITLFSTWQPNLDQTNLTPFPSRLRPEMLLNLLIQLREVPLLAIALFSILALLIAFPLLGSRLLALFISLTMGVVFFGQWMRILAFWQATPFNQNDPIFQTDISFFIFRLPILQLIEFWLLQVTLVGLITVTLIYLLSGNSLSKGEFPGFSPLQRRHLEALGGVFTITISLSYWLARYELLYSQRSVAFGAGFTDVKVQLPLFTVLSISAFLYGIFLLQRALQRHKKEDIWQQIIIASVSYIAIASLGAYFAPGITQRLLVQPNEIERERPYIQRSIAYTREAFNLNQIEIEDFDPSDRLTRVDLENNQATLRNIRLWDTRPLLQTNRQLQQIRLYYKFPDADIDRYLLPLTPNSPLTPQQTIIAARELDYESVPPEAQTWVNEHLVYTHGYGFTLSPVNTVAPGGLPSYFVRDIGSTQIGGANLWTANESIRAAIPTNNPRIYYGEITNTTIMTPTQAPEFDFPSGDENAYNNYDGTGGISIGSSWRRTLFAYYLRNWQMLFTRNFSPETKVLFRRNIKQRIQAIAPFLRFDNNPYLVVADVPQEGSELNTNPNHLYWMIDAYTISDRFPYSDPGTATFNYIRNSVKIIIDAYNGNVQLYIADPTDPIIQTFASIFPQMFQPLEAMPTTLLTHIRYPIDLFKVQSEQLLTYHMTDPQVFYNREDQWRVPMEIYGSEMTAVEPYYLIMRLPTAPQEEFILLLPFTPTSRNNLIGWLAGRSDGENYGKLLLYRFPKERLVFGPEQIEARINQDPLISEQISLWNREGSRALQGNLLVIPLEESLLYVEPLYLEATQNSIPTLVRVIVAYEDRIVMAETLQQALESMFQRTTTPTEPPIIRPLEAEPGAS